MSGNTRNRVLIASLLLFNEKGEPRTTTNEIANEVDISPGNLHYHFRRKEQIVEALLDAFQTDAQQVLRPPEAEDVSLDDFWVFLHLLLECTAAYRFLFRDIEALADTYPRAGRVLGKFARGLHGVFEIYLRELARGGLLDLNDSDASLVSRNLAVIALFSDRFDGLADQATLVEPGLACRSAPARGGCDPRAGRPWRETPRVGRRYRRGSSALPDVPPAARE